MTVSRFVEAGVAAASAAIESALEPEVDGDSLLLGVNVLAFLRANVPTENLSADAVPLVEAYSDWLNSACDFYSTNDESLVRTFARRAAILSTEMRLAGASEPAEQPEDAAGPGGHDGDG